MQTTLPKYDVVLLGIGHTNAHILRMWRMEPIPDARLTCISNLPIATYSGMLPGVLAGQYAPEEMEIDLVRLCAAAGARLIVGKVTGLDSQRRELLFDDRPPLPFDVLSIGIGSVPTREGLVHADDTLLPIKPMQTFLQRLEARLRSTPAACSSRGAELRVVIAGGGVGGVEIALCLPARVRKVLGDVPLIMTIVHPGEQVAEGTLPRTSEQVERQMQASGVEITHNRRIIRVESGSVTLDDGQRLRADLVLWATSAAPPPLLTKLDLPTDERGFLLTRRTLQTTADLPIFVVGDSGTIAGQKLAKAGVYAVREGPILWDNIQRLVAARPLVEYRPQRGFLKLINSGNGQAIGEYHGLTFRGRWAWVLKDYIDRKFMAMYQDYTPMSMDDRPLADSTPAAGSSRGAKQPRCAGCGGKVGGSVLAKALARLEIPAHERVIVGLAQADDAAIVQPATGSQLAVTTDFFAAPLDDPYTVGRLAALHAASDVLAKGARPIAALAMATIPPGPERQQEQLLFELLAGGLHELKALGATLAGGHTIEGPQLTIGYTVLGEQRQALRAKGSLGVGDALVLTKPLGTGVLLAAHMQARLKAEWLSPLLEAMLRSNEPAARLLDKFAVEAATDITGFGLAGHLLEMLRASDCAAEIELAAIGLLTGAAELLQEGLESTLADANRDAQREIGIAEFRGYEAEYAALFDPQTCGGLLIGIAEDQAEELCRTLIESGDKEARIIGRVVPKQDGGRLRIFGQMEAMAGAALPTPESSAASRP